MAHQGTQRVPECPRHWSQCQPDLDLNFYNPMDESTPPCIQAFFDGLLQSPHLLLDKCILPSDGGE
eukprot:CAMPEP_0168221812 /NCGR_PEP_ID=MMETSP0140_2-20121125/10161_1 /TAXON_ID=44445 /ORGANISM="Pseudo-nitzschia australis, Strain 10249 10 AB" /LENGTH=65 /DNA_ID=CAMNT_0008151021 /DNA_START=46 /DNA_END=240 /DNA_ORIENTATION=-